jgi:hypothetical protein
VTAVLRRRRFARPFTPTRIPGLVADYDPSVLSGLADGAGVANLAESAGRQPPISQATGANQPLLKVAIVNGRPVLRCDGANTTASATWMAAASGLLQPNTMVLVAKFNATPASAFGAATDGRAGARHTFYKDNAAAGKWALYAGGSVVSSTTAVDQNWHVLEAVVNGAASFLYLDGVALLSNVNPGSNRFNGVTIGSANDGSQKASLDIARFLAWNRILSSAERSQLRTHLGLAYRISVSLP